MKKYIAVFILIIIPQFVYCQLEIKIDSIFVIRGKYERIGVWAEGDFGPAVNLNATLNNVSKENIKISFYYLEYKYNDSIYTVECSDSYFYQYNIKPNETKKVIIGEDLIHATPIYTKEHAKAVKLDFSIILLQILPTLRLKVITEDKNTYYSTEINKVKLG